MARTPTALRKRVVATKRAFGRSRCQLQTTRIVVAWNGNRQVARSGDPPLPGSCRRYKTNWIAQLNKWGTVYWASKSGRGVHGDSEEPAACRGVVPHT